MNVTQSIDDTMRRVHIPSTSASGNPDGNWLNYRRRVHIPSTSASSNPDGNWLNYRPSDLVGLAAVGTVATKFDWGKPHIGRPKRNKTKTRMAKESRKRNRKP